MQRAGITLRCGERASHCRAQAFDERASVATARRVRGCSSQGPAHSGSVVVVHWLSGS